MWDIGSISHTALIAIRVRLSQVYSCPDMTRYVLEGHNNIVKWIECPLGRPTADGLLSRASTSHSGGSGNPKLIGSDLDLAVFEPWSSQTHDFKIDT